MIFFKNNVNKHVLAPKHRNYWKKVETTPPGKGKIFKEIFLDGTEKKPPNISRFPSLNSTIPNIPELQKEPNLTTPKAHISTLPNGIKIASEELYEQMAYVGVFVEAGSRFEPSDKFGVSLLAEQVGFKGSTKHSPAHFMQKIEKLGANILTTHDRELVVYYIETLRDFIPEIMEILAETLIHPKITQANVEAYLPIAKYELATLMNKGDQLLAEMVHHTAFQGDSLGRPKLELFQNIHNLTAQDLIDYHKENFVGPKITISAASVNHERILKYATQNFSEIPYKEVILPKANYTGGLNKFQAPPNSTEEEKEYLSIGFNCPGWSADRTSVILCLLQKIMGGGQSFSSGGPGKGMYSRIYRNMLCGTDWIHSVECNVNLYNETGLFSISGSSKPGNIMRLLERTLAQYIALIKKPVEGDELLRAKNALKSSIFFNLEHRSLLCEDMGRQVTIYDRKFSAQDSCNTIDGITTEDITQVVKNFLLSNPTVVAIGQPDSLSRLPVLHQIQQFIDEYTK